MLVRRNHASICFAYGWVDFLCSDVMGYRLRYSLDNKNSLDPGILEGGGGGSGSSKRQVLRGLTP